MEAITSISQLEAADEVVVSNSNKARETKISFEIGSTYYRNNVYYIGIGNNKVLTVRKQKEYCIQPRVNYRSVWISVEDLCKLWKLSIEEFDVLLEKYIKPIRLPNTRLGSRKKAIDPQEFILAVRLHRFAQI